MSTQLHERRKHRAADQGEHQPDEEQPVPPQPSIAHQKPQPSKQTPPRRHHSHEGYVGGAASSLLAVAVRDMKNQHLLEGRKEAWCGVLAVLLFLLAGLGLSHIIMHAQHRQVVLHVMKHPWIHGPHVFSQARIGFHHHFYSGSPRYVTVVMPSVVNPNGRVKRLKSIQDTWGKLARSIFVLHNITEFPQVGDHHVISDTLSPHDPYSYPQALMVPDTIDVEAGVPRLIHTIQSIHKKIDPDFAFFVNDHTYVIPEHLCNYLEPMDPSVDLYAGHALNDRGDVFNSGAAGYLLSRSTMAKLVKTWDEQTDPNCNILADGKGQKWIQGNPGLLTTRCLDRSFNISAIDTREEAKFHRFHAFPLTRVVSGEVDQWYIDKHTTEVAHKIGTSDTYATMLTGEDCCAPTTVSFHYVEYLESKALFATREKLLEQPSITDHELKEFMMLEWPKKKKDIGFYSRPLPAPDKLEGDDGWAAILKVMRKISTRETQRNC